MLIEQEMEIAKVRSAHMPMEVLGLQIESEYIGQQRIERAVIFLAASDPGSGCRNDGPEVRSKLFLRSWHFLELLLGISGHVHRVRFFLHIDPSIYCGARGMQSVFPGKIHSRVLFIAVMKRYGSLGMLYQRVIAFPTPVRLLMQLHFNLYALVDGFESVKCTSPCLGCDDRTRESAVWSTCNRRSTQLQCSRPGRA